tara:strand:+ start:288 stop:830 length:543 start_codon:yes stop_codon:yes gene_type:complete
MIISTDNVRVFFVLSLAYITCYTLTNGLIAPLQSLFLPNYTTTISLMFLPHGIRVLAAYYYGWKSFFFLMPSAYLMWFVIVYGAEVPLHPLQPIFSSLSCIIGVMIITRYTTGHLENEWKILLLGGLIGSSFNGISSSFLQNDGIITSSIFEYILGDMLGQIILMVLLLYMFKFLRVFKI